MLGLVTQFQHRLFLFRLPERFSFHIGHALVVVGGTVSQGMQYMVLCTRYRLGVFSSTWLAGNIEPLTARAGHGDDCPSKTIVILYRYRDSWSCTKYHSQIGRDNLIWDYCLSTRYPDRYGVSSWVCLLGSGGLYIA